MKTILLVLVLFFN